MKDNETQVSATEEVVTKITLSKFREVYKEGLISLLKGEIEEIRFTDLQIRFGVEEHEKINANYLRNLANNWSHMLEQGKSVAVSSKGGDYKITIMDDSKKRVTRSSSAPKHPQTLASVSQMIDDAVAGFDNVSGEELAALKMMVVAALTAMRKTTDQE